MTVRGVKFKFDCSESVLCFEPDVTKARVLYNAKILEVHVGRNSDGLRQPEYLVHFLGWNSSWDRIVPEPFVLSNSEEHRDLMKLLAQTAKKIKRNSLRKRKIESLLRKYFHEDPEMAANFRTTVTSSQSESDAVEDGSGSEGEESDLDSTLSAQNLNASHVVVNLLQELGNMSDHEMTITGNDDLKRVTQVEDVKPDLVDAEPRKVTLDLPETLKRCLEDDCYYVSCLDKKVELPANPNVISVLEGYVKNFTANLIYGTTEKKHPRRDKSKNPPHEKNVELVKEAMDGLRVFFDFTLPAVLLYSNERAQYHRAMATSGETDEQGKQQSPEAEVIQSPRLRSRPSLSSPASSPTAKNGCVSPRGSRLSPRGVGGGMKKELEESPVEESPPPTRRIKRNNNTLSDSVRKRILSESKMDTESPAVREKSTKYEEIPGEDSASRKITLRSGATRQTQFAELTTIRTKRKSGEVKAATLADRVTVPPPLVLAESSKDSTSSHDTSNQHGSESSDPSMIYCNGYKTKEAAMDHICTWRLVPESVLSQTPAMPSTVYGAHHLLRLFVQLPSILSQMAIPNKQHRALMSHLEMFVDYLSERSEELFPENVYK